MCVAVAEAPDTLIATGFRHGENATQGYVDEGMFLVGGGEAFLTKYRLRPDGSLEQLFDLPISIGGGGDGASESKFSVRQGMRTFYDSFERHYIVSHTTSLTDGAFEFGLSAVALDGTLKWTRVYPAASNGLRGHQSHPYALTQAAPGDGYAIGGLAVIYDAKRIEQCEGRLVGVAADGTLNFDRRFLSDLPDTNIECYGLQPTADGGFIMTCGTGVEPELHPKDSPRAKTWRALVHRTDARGIQLWQKAYTSNADLKNNAGEYILLLRDGGYAVLIDSQSWGSPSTGGNFAIMRLARDDAAVPG